MGVPVLENEDMFSDEDSNGFCNCSCTSCNTNNSSSVCDSTSSSHYMSNMAYKDIVGNCKEVRIEDNTSNLRIVGNNNRIRITLNTGDLIVIGNNTRLKIQQNHGHIKYTGNDGRISLGYQSQQQLVDYIGCNGVLKVCHSNNKTSTSSTKVKCTKNQENNNKFANVNNKTPHNESTSNSCATTNQKLYCHLPCEENIKKCNATKCKETATNGTGVSVNTGKSREKSHSYGGRTKFNHDQPMALPPQWHKFKHMFPETDRKSVPNLSGYTYEPTGLCSREQPSSIIQTLGNIVIANASNICISPYVNNFTAKV